MTLSLTNIHSFVKPNPWGSKKQILQDINLTLAAGEVVGLLGPNGAGKTTLIKVLLGLLQPSQGQTEIMGQAAHLPHSRAQLGYLPERASYPVRLTAREFVYAHARLAGLSNAEAQVRTTSVLGDVGLGESCDRRLGTYSKGMLQRAGLAQALVADPKILVLDEPMSGLDPIGRRDVRDLLLRLKQEGKTILFSTHILPDVDAVCDRVAVLVGGRLKRVATPHTLTPPAERPYEITVEPLDADTRAACEKMGAKSRTQPHTTHLSVCGADSANALVKELVRRGAVLQSMTTTQSQLESLFAKESA